MKQFLAISCLVLCIELINAAAPDCSSKANGYIVAADSCHEFYICINKQSILKYCPSGLHFESSEGVCKKADKILTGPCSPKTICNKNGAKISHENCKKFFLCIEGKPVEKECGDSTHFDVKNNVCKSPEKINGPCFVPLNVCQNQVDGRTFPHQNKESFYFCHNEEPSVVHCTPGLYYNEEKKFCEAHGTPKDHLFPCK